MSELILSVSNCWALRLDPFFSFNCNVAVAFFYISIFLITLLFYNTFLEIGLQGQKRYAHGTDMTCYVNSGTKCAAILFLLIHVQLAGNSVSSSLGSLLLQARTPGGLLSPEVVPSFPKCQKDNCSIIER